MATRFGAVSPAQTFATRVRWLVGCLVAVILTLVGTVFFLVRGSDSTEVVQQPADTGVADASATPKVEVLFATRRIETGETLQEADVKIELLHPEKVPPGAFRASEKGELIGKYAKSKLNPELPIVRDDVTMEAPGPISIPQGFRATTIQVDARSGVEGWARPNSRVDLLWTYTDRDGMKKVATIARFIKILSVAGRTAATSDGSAPAPNAGPANVTLLVTEKDAKKIELARNLGSLSLSLVGDTGGESLNPNADPVTMETILGTPTNAKPEEGPINGTMYVRDPRTGKNELYELRNNRWVRAGGKTAASEDSAEGR